MNTITMMTVRPCSTSHKKDNRNRMQSLLIVTVVLLSYGVTVANAFSTTRFSKSTKGTPLTASIQHEAEHLSSITPTAGSRLSPPKISKVRIPKPLGIVLEELEGGEGGVRIIQVNPEGNAAQTLPEGSLCVRDKLQAVNGEDVSTETFDVVMEKIISSGDATVELTLQRPEGSIVVNWENGVSVAAQPKEYLGNVAFEAGMKIPYSCRSGSCGTCEQSVSIDEEKEQRYCRPCSFRIPKGVHSMTATPSDRFWA